MLQWDILEGGLALPSPFRLSFGTVMISERRKHRAFCNAYRKAAFWEKHYRAPPVLSQSGDVHAGEAEGNTLAGLMTAL